MKQPDLFAPRRQAPPAKLNRSTSAAIEKMVTGRVRSGSIELNDHWIAYYARRFHDAFPELGRVFETRPMTEDALRRMAFLDFDLKHPDVWTQFQRFTRRALTLAPGKLVGARMIWELIRWHLTLSDVSEILPTVAPEEPPPPSANRASSWEH